MLFLQLLTAFWLGPSAFALEIPQNLNVIERRELTRMLGISTSAKILSDPYPLGGYSGLEIGVAMEVINTLDLSRWGTKTSPQGEFRYPRFSIGKGLYHNVDLFFQFTPFGETNQLTQYGGMIKWTFYQSKFLPITFSALAHTSTINLNDSFINETIGGEIMAGINVDSFALYFGMGQLQARAQFMSCKVGACNGSRIIVNPADDAVVNSPNGIVYETMQEGHSFVGVSIQVLDVFAAAQIDNYRDPVYSAKIGVRF